MNTSKTLSRIRYLIIFFMVVTALSGITAFPVYSELKFIQDSGIFSQTSLIGGWLLKVWTGIKNTQENYPYLFYGYDWLAFAHIMIALLFIGPYRDPVRNKWVIDWGILSCLAVLPLAFIAGPIREIPWFHILIDCSFGLVGLIPLFMIKRWIKQLETAQDQ